MQRHPYFDLWLHSDAELEGLLGQPLAARATLHEWPLSCVQRIELADGATWVYKTQFHEGVEAAFYARVRSPLLPACRALGSFETTVCLLLEFIDAPLLAQTKPGEAEALAHAARLETAIAEIAGDPPLYMDLGSPERWSAFARDTGAKLERIVADGRFAALSPAALRALDGWVRSPEVLDAASRPALAHADLSASNVFLAPASPLGYRVIDWQYPRRLAAGFDRACLFDSLGLDPARAAGPLVARILYYLRLAWFAECQLRLFPQGDYAPACARLLAQIV